MSTTICPTCNGLGRFYGPRGVEFDLPSGRTYNNCSKCHGTGRLEATPTPEVDDMYGEPDDMPEAAWIALHNESKAPQAQPASGEVEIRDLLDFANPNTPRGFWRKDRAAERIQALLAHARAEARREELEICLGDLNAYADNHATNGLRKLWQARLAELGGSDE